MPTALSKYRFLARPKWLAFHLLIVLAVVLMVNLGFWQLHRLQDRREFNDTVRSHASQPVAPIATVIPPGAATDDLEWRTVEASGEYLADEQVLVINLSQGGQPGQNVLTPLRLADGRLLLVNRGFVPDRETVPPTPTGSITVTGRLRASQQRTFGAISDPAEGDLREVRRIDVERLARQLPGDVVPLYVDVLSSTPDEGPLPVPVLDPELDEGPHLSYMLQWWFFSGCAIVGWVLAVRRSTRTRSREDQLSAADEPADEDLPLPVGAAQTTAPTETPNSSPG